jgi:osmotically-inducible protein OsmY
MYLLVLAASLVLSGRALAQSSDFAALDRNRDGYVSRIEALADAEIHKRFGQFDTDQDRRLSPAEYTAALDDNNLRIRRDAALAERVRAALVAERAIMATAISVESYEGQVELSGFVPAPDMASRAGRVTAGVDGVRFVHNNLAVRAK